MTEAQPTESLYGSEPQPELPKAPNLLDQVAGIFTEPVALFGRLGQTPRWGHAFLLVAVADAVMMYLWGRRVDAEGVFGPILERNPNIPSEKIPDIAAIQAKWAWVNVPIFYIIGALVAALVFWLVAKGFAEGERVSYRKALSATVVPWLVSLPKALLLAIICATKNFGAAMVDVLSPTSVAFYVEPASNRIHHLLAAVDLFTFASIAMAWLAARHLLRLTPAGSAICAGFVAAAKFLLPLLQG